jgi:hypothetical protein
MCPTDFNSKPHPQTNPDPKPESDKKVEPEKHPDQELKMPAPSLEDRFTADLSESEKSLLNQFRDKIKSENLVINMLFDADTSVQLPLFKDKTFDVRILTTENKDLLEKYSFGKDPLKLFESEDMAEISAIQGSGDDKISQSQAREIFLRTFPLETARRRYAAVSLAMVVVKINGKSTGSSIAERFDTLKKATSLMTQTLARHISIFERALTLELTDQDSIKN